MSIAQGPHLNHPPTNRSSCRFSQLFSVDQQEVAVCSRNFRSKFQRKLLWDESYTRPLNLISIMYKQEPVRIRDKGLKAVSIASIFFFYPVLLCRVGRRYSQNYQVVRPEKNTKYARGTYTLNLKKKIKKYLQSEFLKKPSTECMYYFRIMHAVVKLFYCGNSCTFIQLLIFLLSRVWNTLRCFKL